MKALVTTIAAGLLAVSFAATADAAVSKEARQAMHQQQATCKAEAAMKFSAVHLLKRRHFVQNCMAQHTVTPVKPVATMKPATPTTTGQSTK